MAHLCHIIIVAFPLVDAIYRSDFILQGFLNILVKQMILLLYCVISLEPHFVLLLTIPGAVLRLELNLLLALDAFVGGKGGLGLV